MCLIICFTPDKIVGGLGDRIIGLIAIKLIAKVLDRPFYILWTKENITRYFDYKKYDFNSSPIQKFGIKYNKKYNLIDCQQVLKKELMTCKLDQLFKGNCFIYMNQEISQYIFKNPNINRDFKTEIINEYETFLDRTLIPRSIIYEKINNIIQDKKNIIGIQIRCGDAYMDTNSNDNRKYINNTITNTLNLLTDLHKFINNNYFYYNIFLTTDNLKCYEQARHIFKDKLLYNHDLIQHIDRKPINDDISKVFVDFILLAKYTNIIFITENSNYGRISALCSKNIPIFNLYCKKLKKINLITRKENLFAE